MKSKHFCAFLCHVGLVKFVPMCCGSGGRATVIWNSHACVEIIDPRFGNAFRIQFHSGWNLEKHTTARKHVFSDGSIQTQVLRSDLYILVDLRCPMTLKHSVQSADTNISHTAATFFKNLYSMTDMLHFICSWCKKYQFQWVWWWNDIHYQPLTTTKY